MCWLIKIKQLSEQLRRENEYLAAEVKASRDLRLVVGTSPSFTKVVDLLKAVAPTDTTVLLGERAPERGVGPSPARPQHSLRQAVYSGELRRASSGLIESELFGHERGAFTGRNCGNRDALNWPTPAPCSWTKSAKCRWRPNQTAARAPGWHGGSHRQHPLAVDVRVIAATNADLSAAIRQGTFRQICTTAFTFSRFQSPLRENVAKTFRSSRSIFSRRIGTKLKRPHLTFDTQSMARLLTYNWPGNVRELQNVIERAIILSHSSRVTVGDVASTVNTPPKQHGVTPVNLGDLERHHITEVLQRTKWRIYGERGRICWDSTRKRF